MSGRWKIWLNNLEDNRILSSVRKGLIMLIPCLMTGSVAMLLRSLPINAYQDFLQKALGGVLLDLLSFITDSTFGFMSAFLVIGVSFHYSYSISPENGSLRVMAVITSFSCFLASFGAASGSLTLAHFGAIGVFTALLCSLIATRLFHTLYRVFSRRFLTYAGGADERFHTAFSAILPFAVCVVCFVLMNQLIHLVWQVDNFNDLIAKGLISLFDRVESNLGIGALFVFVLNLLWFFGIHGGNMLEQVSQSILVPANVDPNLIVSKSFLDNLVLMGGCGTTLCLLFALLLFSRNRNDRHLASSALPPALFNINEVLVFGLPVVLNPIMLIPFLLVPMTSLLIAYSATALGLVPVVTETVAWTTPVIFSGFAATHSIRGAVLQLVILAAGTAIYIPFVRLSDRIHQDREGILIERLTSLCREGEAAGQLPALLNRHDSIGMAAKSMASQLRSDIAKGNIVLYYQPQADANGRITGAEALLRWKYGERMVYPPLVLALAAEDHTFDALSEAILNKAVEEAPALVKALDESSVVSVNITPQQLNDAAFVDQVISMVDRAGLGGHFCLEVTEGVALEQFEHIGRHLRRFNEHHILMAIDDFSMGHTSLKYLQGNSFQFVKLDGALVRGLPDNPRCRDIVQSIVSLGSSLGFEVVGEYVESEQLREELVALGCHYFQGYLYSPAIPADELAQYCREMELSAELEQPHL